MAKKLSVQVNYFEDYHLLGLVSNLKDYKLTFNLNNILHLDLKKFDDLNPGNDDISYSWYCHKKIGEPYNYYLLGNYHPKAKLIPSEKSLDYFIFIKNAEVSLVKEMTSEIRKIDGVTAVFQIDMAKIKDMNIILEMMELHELEQVIRPSKPTLW